MQASCAHTLFDIVSIAILAVTCGADDGTDLETFGKKRREWLATFLELRGGIPSHDTFRRVLGLLDRPRAVLYQIGSRGREVLQSFIELGDRGSLIHDGYAAYQAF